jgi:hypothetical protein
LFGQNHQQKHYFHIITLFLCPKKNINKYHPIWTWLKMSRSCLATA